MTPESMPTVDELVERIREFLSVRRESEDGGWPKVDREDMTEFVAIVADLRDLKFDRDCDRDAVIELDFVDRSLGYKPNVPQVPHLHKLDGEAKERGLLECFRAAEAMASGAAEILRVAGGDMGDMLRRREREKAQPGVKTAG